jgi:hypothetical protein
VITVRRRKVVVNLVDGRAIVGDRRLSWPWQVVVSAAHVTHRDGQSVPIDGRTIIPRHRIDWIQVVS